MSMKSKAEEAERRADELYAQHFGGKKDEGATEDPKPPDSTDVESASGVLLQDEPKGDEGAEPVTAEPAIPEPAPEPPPKKEVDWEHKYKVLQGKYNKEVAEQRKLVDMVTNMDGQIKSLSESLLVLTSKDTDAKKAERIESIEQFKQEYPSIYAGVVAQVEESLSASITPQIEEVKGKIEAREKADAASAQEVFFSVLAGIVPDWDTVNNDPEFHDWLQGREKYARENRYAQLERSYRAGDAKAVAEFMTDFKAFQSSERSRKASEQAVAQKKTEGKVAPETVKPSPPKLDRTDPTPGVITTAFITDFYNRAARGKITDSEYAKIDAEIQKAAREGRVVKSKNIAP